MPITGKSNGPRRAAHAETDKFRQRCSAGRPAGTTAAPSECSGPAGSGSTSTCVICDGQIRCENGSQEWLPALPYVSRFLPRSVHFVAVARLAADRSAGKIPTRRVTADAKEEVP